MGLPEIYEKLFGKQADEAKAESNDATPEGEVGYTDEEIEAALAQMSDDELDALAKETAEDIKKSMAKEQEALQKEAEELYAAGRIFGQGFLAEVNGKANGEKAAEPQKKSAISKFAALLDKELKSEQSK